MITTAYWSSSKVPVILETWNFSTDFQKTLKYQILWTSAQCQLRCSMWMDR